MMHKIEEHLWRTADGRLVETGHPDGQFLAYAKGDEIPDDVAKREGLVKAVRKPADKAVRKPADKAARVDL